MWQGTRTVPLPSRIHTHEAFTPYVSSCCIIIIISRVVISKLSIEENRE